MAYNGTQGGGAGFYAANYDPFGFNNNVINNNPAMNPYYMQPQQPQQTDATPAVDAVVNEVPQAAPQIIPQASGMDNSTMQLMMSMQQSNNSAMQQMMMMQSQAIQTQQSQLNSASKNMGGRGSLGVQTFNAIERSSYS